MDDFRSLSRADLVALELIREPIWVYDLDHGTMWWANELALGLFSAPSIEALRTRQLRDTMSAGMRRRLDVYRARFLEGAAITESWTFYPPERPPLVARCACSGVQISDERGERLAMLVHAREASLDVPRAEQRLAELVHHSSEWISLYRPDGQLLLRNPAAEQVMGRGQGGDDFTASFSDPATAREAREAVRGGTMFHREVQVGERWADTEVSSVIDPMTGEPAILVVQHEVTEQHAVAQRLEQLRDEAERDSRSKSRFLGVISHELRTPMTGVLASAALLRDSPLSPEQQEILSMLCEAGEAMSALIEDVLETSRLEADTVPIEPQDVEIRALIEELLRAVRGAAQRRSLTLEVRYDDDLPAFLHLDPLRLRQILSNLLSNAIKFSDRGTITLALSWQAQQLTASVTDQGAGISEGMLAELCRPFVQGSITAQRARGGVGLGLYIVESLTAALGGTLGVQSTPGEGSTFTVALPAPRAAAPPAPAPRTAPELLPLTILLVDDNDLNRRILSRLLERWGCTVIQAASGEAALAAAAAQPPDVILMDIWMPDMDGVTAARLIRARGLSAGPIFAMTADARVTAGTEDVFDDCLQKPFAHTDLQHLLAAVRH